jgi:hypothetical protein
VVELFSFDYKRLGLRSESSAVQLHPRCLLAFSLKYILEANWLQSISICNGTLILAAM